MIHAPSLSPLPTSATPSSRARAACRTGIYASLNGGIGSNDAPENVRENRARMASALGVAPTHLVTCYQIHSPDVIVADEPWTRENSPRADAIVTRVPGLAVGVGTADCGPVLFADAEAGVVGAAHAGWKGALTGVLEATIAAMEKLGAHAQRIRAAIGPLIRQPNYEVGAGIRRALHGGRRRERALLRAAPRAPATRCSTCPATSGPGSNALKSQGIEDLGLCTYADPARFFSYRRTTHRGEPDYGRHVNAIALMK